MSILLSMQGQVALVTGGTRGIGRAIAQTYAEAGARLIISSENNQDCQQTVLWLNAQGFEAVGIQADLSDRSQVLALGQTATTVFDRIDVLVCNAGIAPHSGPLAEASDSQWQATFEVNLRSAVLLTNALIPHIAKQGGGSVVLLSSIAGIRGNKALGLYGLSKAALSQLARNLAVEWGPNNVRVNAISPGVIQTDFARPLTDDACVLQKRLALTPLRRVGTPEEVAAVALLLASPGGAFITGQNLVVDGGTTISDGN
ncbi:SDR family oxidoreductase [Pseudomonas sp. PB101]|uniref:SDR family NAD(P)-dependent oxidoreductase n=1 Tax=Pseudomonas sp. PB101 TaxID=2495428 RepID=UPI0013666594|nr:SDR family oxidoreductase [Pseudomonas sp. PB101]MVW84799.1 SDR family oxidoreductase [Pseudomonas sp. PB101]